MTLTEILQLCEIEKHADHLPLGSWAARRRFNAAAREELPRLAKVLQKVSAVGHIFCSAFPGPCPKDCDRGGGCEIEEIANAFVEAGVTE